MDPLNGTKKGGGERRARTTHETFVRRVARTRLNLLFQTFVSSFRSTDMDRREQRGRRDRVCVYVHVYGKWYKSYQL